MRTTTACPYGVVFDLDGTLVHSVPDLRVALNRLLSEIGGRAVDDDAVRLMVGDGVEAFVQRGLAAAGLPPPADAAVPALVRRFLDLYEAAPAALTRPWPRAGAALGSLRAEGVRLGVCTNKPTTAAIDLLDQLGLSEFFSGVVGQGSTPFIKPDPRPLLATLDAMGVARERAVMVGDSVNDVQVARNVGIPVILVSFGYTAVPARELGADAVIDDFADLAAAVSSLWR
ncbi:MAG: phosphoglycolate phosphatase [Alphaproteobacteria bacterium]